MSKRAVRLGQRLLDRIGVREWGYPSLVTPGQIWRSREAQTVTCIVASGKEAVEIDCRPLTIVEPGDSQWIPKLWRSSIWRYVKAYPASGAGLTALVWPADDERAKLLRSLKPPEEDWPSAWLLYANMMGNIAALGATIDDPSL